MPRRARDHPVLSRELLRNDRLAGFRAHRHRLPRCEMAVQMGAQAALSQPDDICPGGQRHPRSAVFRVSRELERPQAGPQNLAFRGFRVDRRLLFQRPLPPTGTNGRVAGDPGRGGRALASDLGCERQRPLSVMDRNRLLSPTITLPLA
jgi:hypothetical protein